MQKNDAWREDFGDNFEKRACVVSIKSLIHLVSMAKAPLTHKTLGTRDDYPNTQQINLHTSKVF